jgi:acyl-CoA reductase-like NAD-dependent aldehyde dehydrogenase
VTVTVINPATEETIATLESVGVEETDAAVARATAAFPGCATRK